MRTDPFYDTWLFLSGQHGDQMALGVWRWLVVALFIGLILTSILIAAREWVADPLQRNGRDLTMWFLRCLVGGSCPSSRPRTVSSIGPARK